MLLLCKIRILVFLLILGLTILLGNTKQQQQKKLLFFAFPLTSVIFQFLFHGVFWSWFRPNYFFRDLYGYVSESEVARILDEWYAATWLVDFVVCFDSPFYLDLISTHLHVVSCLCEDTDCWLFLLFCAPATWSVDILMKNNVVDFVWVLHLGWSVYTLVKHCWLFVMPQLYV